jgi:hypothetical protein
MTRPKGDFLEHAAVFAKGDLGFRATVQVIENCSWQSAPSQRSKIVDVDNPGRRDRSRSLYH